MAVAAAIMRGRGLVLLGWFGGNHSVLAGYAYDSPSPGPCTHYSEPTSVCDP